MDCRLVERASWPGYLGMGVGTEGLLVIGGLVESFEIPFEVRSGQGCVRGWGLLYLHEVWLRLHLKES